MYGGSFLNGHLYAVICHFISHLRGITVNLADCRHDNFQHFHSMFQSAILSVFEWLHHFFFLTMKVFRPLNLMRIYFFFLQNQICLEIFLFYFACFAADCFVVLPLNLTNPWPACPQWLNIFLDEHFLFWCLQHFLSWMSANIFCLQHFLFWISANVFCSMFATFFVLMSANILCLQHFLPWMSATFLRSYQLDSSESDWAATAVFFFSFCLASFLAQFFPISVANQRWQSCLRCPFLWQ